MKNWRWVNRIKSWRWGFLGAVLVLWALGTVSYCCCGYPFFESAYLSVKLFVVDCKEEDLNWLLYYVLRFLCPAMTVAAIVAVASSLLVDAVDSVRSRMGNATAVYADTEQMKKVAAEFERPVMMHGRINRYARSHVLLLDRDLDNLDLYSRMMREEGLLAKGSRVYIKLDKIESGLLDKMNPLGLGKSESRLLGVNDAYYFNVNEMIARSYWKTRTLEGYIQNGTLGMRIGIIGFGPLGQSLLTYGLMNNLYAPDQAIAYHVWGDSRVYRSQLGAINMMNGDTITWYDSPWVESKEEIGGLDRIILAGEPDVEVLQTLMFANPDAEIDFYNPQNTPLSEIYAANKMTGFGVLSQVLTEENIKTDALYRTAMMVNYDYHVNKAPAEYSWDAPNVEELMEQKWVEMSGFFKGSNIAAADYHRIRLLMMEALGLNANELTEEQKTMLMKMEHTRWSRYFYMNHWNYAPKRDNTRRRHHLLVPYEELDKEEQQKDWNTICTMLTRIDRSGKYDPTK